MFRHRTTFWRCQVAFGGRTAIGDGTPLVFPSAKRRELEHLAAVDMTLKKIRFLLELPKVRGCPCVCAPPPRGPGDRRLRWAGGTVVRPEGPATPDPGPTRPGHHEGGELAWRGGRDPPSLRRQSLRQCVERGAYGAAVRCYGVGSQILARHAHLRGLAHLQCESHQVPGGAGEEQPSALCGE